MIRFGEDIHSDYQSRTRINVIMSDITVAFAVDDTTSGERATKKFAEESSTPFFAIKINERGKIPGSERDNLNTLFIVARNIGSQLESGITLNVAGNGMATLSKYGITQERVDELVFNILSKLKENGVRFHAIRSGGQTGVDEAALKAGDKLGIQTLCLAPHGWKFRDADGQDICDEALFKRRFMK